MKPYESHLQDDPLRRYLLGTLDEREQSDLEERMFGEDEFFDRVELAEEDLIEDYLDGNLHGAEKQRFERHFLSSPARRRHLQLARSLRALFAEPDAATVHPVGWMRPGKSQWAAVGLAAAVILMVSGVAASAVALYRGRTRIAENQVSALQARLAEVRSNAERAKAAAAASASPVEPEALVAFVLAPGISRGEEAKRIRISAGTSNLRLVLEPETPRQQPDYRVTIADSDRRVIWTQRFRQAGQAEEAAWIVDVPARLFRSGAYVATLESIDAGGRAVLPDDYAFRIEVSANRR